MRILLQIQIPHEEFNAAARDGSAGQKLGKILEDAKTKPHILPNWMDTGG